MSERSLADPIGPIHEIRPSEDLSLLQTYELRRIFDRETIASLDLIGPPDLREPDSFRPISAPMVTEARDPQPAASEPIHAHVETTSGPADAVEVRRTPQVAPTAETEVPRRDWLLDPEPIAQPFEAQPYGDDPARVRELVQWFADGRGFADGRAASSSVLVQRAAGDLLPGPTEPDAPPARLRAVSAGRRAG